MSDDDGIDLTALAENVGDVLRDAFDRRSLHRFVDGDAAVGRSLWEQAGALGWIGIGLSENVGGMGLGVAGMAAIQAELGAVVAPGPYLSTMAASLILDEMAGQGCAELLGRVAEGSLRIAIPAVFDDGDGRLDDAPIRMIGDSDGERLLIETYDGDGRPGLSLIDRADVTVRPLDGWDRSRQLFTADCTGVRPLLILDGDPGAAAVRRLRAVTSVLLSADSLGGAGAILAQTIAYLKTREQFGKPIGSFQALKHRVADLSTLVRTNHCLLDQAIAADGTPAASLWASLAKASATDAYRAIAADCVQLHGGIGFTWEHECHLYLKRARLNEALLATNGTVRDWAAEELGVLIEAGYDAMEIAA